MTAWSTARLRRLHDVISGYVGRGYAPGAVTLVSRRGDVHVDAIGTKAFGGSEPMCPDTIFRIASMTKPITATAAMILVEECKLRLDEPVDRLLPELADRRVLTRPEAALDATVPAIRPITLRDLLTFRLGIGAILAPAGQYPIQVAMAEAGLAPGPDPPSHPPPAWMEGLSRLPLIYQPGETWLYHTGSDILGVLIARAAGQPLEEFFRERIFEPLGMADTGFRVPADKLDRLPPSYATDMHTGAVRVHDDPATSRWGRPPVFASGGAGLVSTAGDYLTFCQMLLNNGRYGGERILSRPSVELMTTDQLTAQQKAAAWDFFGDSRGWGFGLGVSTRRTDLCSGPGRFGWDGGCGTSGYSDPNEDMVGILLTQRLLISAEPPSIFADFWTSAYQALGD